MEVRDISCNIVIAISTPRRTFSYRSPFHGPLYLTLRRTRVDKVNAELVTLTYGTMVAQLCSDFDSDYTEVNKQLDKMGYNIGMRLVEDFFAKSGTQRCANLRETAETISKVCTRGTFNVNRYLDLLSALEANCTIDRFQNLFERHAHRCELDRR